MGLGNRIWRQARLAVVPEGLLPHERQQLRHHLGAAMLTGLFMGALTLADTVLAKTLHGSALAVTVMTVLIGVSFLASLFWAGAMHNRSKTPFILAAGLLGRGGLALAGLSTVPAWFIFTVGLGWMGQAMIINAQVAIIQRSYRLDRRNQLFGVAVSAATVMRLVATVVAGRILDLDEQAYGLIFAVAGLAGLFGAVLLTRMEAGLQPVPTPPGAGELYQPLKEPGFAGGLRSMRQSVGLLLRILREDRIFRRFEINFFIYGIAFLSLLPMVPLFLVHDLGLDYTRIGLARGLMGQTGLILFAPALGRTLEKLKPVRFCARIFSLLALYPGLLLLAGLLPAAAHIVTVYAAFVCFGIAMAGVSIAWSLSSIHFAGSEDPSAYQSVHSVLVGVRGVVAPLLGYLVMSTTSTLHGFALTAALFLLSALLMARMARDEAADGPPEASADARSRD